LPIDVHKQFKTKQTKFTLPKVQNRLKYILLRCLGPPSVRAEPKVSGFDILDINIFHYLYTNGVA